MDTNELISAYDRAWSEADPAERRRLLEAVWVEDGELIDPQGGRIQGRDAIIQRITDFSGRFPGARVEVTSGLDEHHGFVRYGWTITNAQGAPILNGIDVCELSPDGRLRRVIMFFGPLPPRG